MATDLRESLKHLENLISSLSNDVSSMGKTVPFTIENGSYVRVSEDGMQAWIYLNSPLEGEEDYSYETVISFLNQNGVVRGIDTHAVQNIVSRHIYGCEALIAKGTEAIKGRNGYYDYYVSQNDHKRPQIRSDGTYDYSGMARLTGVHKGDRICEYRHAIAGMEGFDVRGNELHVSPTTELPPLSDRGICKDEISDAYYATIDGNIDLIDGKIDIKSIYEQNGDLTGNDSKLEYLGDVHIKGNVEDGAVIHASRHIIVEGIVGNATLNAGGDIVAIGGIRGSDRAVITSGGNVYAETIEQADVEAGGTVRANSFVNSNVSSGGFVMAEGRYGAIVGGKIKGLCGINAKTIGDEYNVVTIVMAGYSGDDYDKYLEFSDKEKETSERLSEIMNEIKLIMKDLRIGKIAERSQADYRIDELNREKDECFTKLDNYRFDKKQYEMIIEIGKGRSICASEAVYGGVIVDIEGATFRVPADTGYVKYQNVGGKIVSRVLG